MGEALWYNQFRCPGIITTITLPKKPNTVSSFRCQFAAARRALAGPLQIDPSLPAYRQSRIDKDTSEQVIFRPSTN